MRKMESFRRALCIFQADESTHGQVQRAAMRLARTAVPAILLTIYALLLGVEHRNEAAAKAAAAAANDSPAPLPAEISFFSASRAWLASGDGTRIQCERYCASKFPRARGSGASIRSW
jgi:hypothetical protein